MRILVIAVSTLLLLALPAGAQQTQQAPPEKMAPSQATPGTQKATPGARYRAKTTHRRYRAATNRRYRAVTRYRAYRTPQCDRWAMRNLGVCW